MIEVIWHGRGGQGAFTAARLLGAAYSLRGSESYALAFPSFGPERRGAPVRAFTKLDSKLIGNRSETAHADFVIYLDDTLFGIEAFDELKPGGLILLNTKRENSDKRVLTLDADTLAQEMLGRPITNTILLGALAALIPQLNMAEVRAAIEQYMPKRLHERNIAAAWEACARVAADMDDRTQAEIVCQAAGGTKL